MGVRRLEDLQCYQLARQFKLEVYRLIRESDEARRDYRYVSEIRAALSGAEGNIAEGFRRWLATENSRFLTYALASLEESMRRLRDGVDRGYFAERDCHTAFELGTRAIKCTTAYWKSQQPFVDALRRQRRAATGRRRPGSKKRPPLQE